MGAELIRHADLVVSPWRNGAGRKADIAAGPGWLAGFAWLDADAPFSDYAGYDRTITLVAGPGFRLEFPPPYPPLVAGERWVPRFFDGGLPARCCIEGPCLVLNAMTERAAWRHSVEIAAPPARLADALLVVLRGTVAVGGAVAAEWDALRLADEAVLQPAGDALAAVIRIRPSGG